MYAAPPSPVCPPPPFPCVPPLQPHHPRDLSSPATERHRRLPADSCFSEGQPPPRAILRASRLMGKERSVRGARPMHGAVHLAYTWHQFPCVRPPDRPFVMRLLTHPTARGPVDNFTLAFLIYIYRPSLALRAADASCTPESPLLSVRRLATGLFGCLDTRVLARSACPAHYLTPTARTLLISRIIHPPACCRFLLDLCSTSSHSKAGDAVCPSPSTHWERSLRHDARRTRLCECREV